MAATYVIAEVPVMIEGGNKIGIGLRRTLNGPVKELILTRSAAEGLAAMIQNLR